MKRFLKLWKIILLDTLGVLLMIVAVLTGFLPGPGGIPLFILGLSLLAVHHKWAERYIDLLKKYADKLGAVIFIKNPIVQWTYDVLAPLAVLAGILLLLRHSAVWMISLGIFMMFIGVTFLLGNRGRWHQIRQSIRGR